MWSGSWVGHTHPASIEIIALQYGNKLEAIILLTYSILIWEQFQGEEDQITVMLL